MPELSYTAPLSGREWNTTNFGQWSLSWSQPCEWTRGFNNNGATCWLGGKVEGVTCVRSTISWYNCVSQTAPRIHRDSTKEGGQGWGSEQPCRGPVHSERGPGRAAWLGVFPCFGFLVCWILEPKAMRARRQGKSYSLLIFPLHWQNGSNYMMVALNVIKGIQSPEARLSHNHDKLLKTAEIAPSLRRRGKSWWCWLKSAALACNRRLSTWKGDSCDFIRSEGVLGSFPRFVPSGHSCELQL